MDKAGDCRKNNSKKENQWRKQNVDRIMVNKITKKEGENVANRRKKMRAVSDPQITWIKHNKGTRRIKENFTLPF